MSRSFQPAGIRLGIARGVSYGLFGPPDEVIAPSRELGAGLVRIYVYWSQVQPEPERWDWTSVDTFLAQLSREEEAWVTVCSSSPWATREATDFLPSSPATGQDAYYRFVHALVSRCAGRVQYWQCNNEPSNIGLLWAGSAGEYVEQLALFHRAVRHADSSAAVVLGGCGYDVLSSLPDEPPRRFFDHVLANAGALFDLFAIHLYDDPVRIPANIETGREMMRAHGYERPVVVGEYNGPTLFELPDAGAALQHMMASVLAAGEDAAELSVDQLAASAELDTPERRAMRALYARMPELPAALQMLMAGCSPELEERRHRINCRQIVTRNLFALSAGVRRTVCWHLAPEVPRYEDPLTMMELLQGKLLLLGYDGDQLTRRYPAADTFRLLADHLDGARAVTRTPLDDHPDVFAFCVERAERGPVLVIWKDGDAFLGEDNEPAFVTWPWPHDTALVSDAFGAAQRLDVEAGRLEIPVSVTPLFLSAASEVRRRPSRVGTATNPVRHDPVQRSADRS